MCEDVIHIFFCYQCRVLCCIISRLVLILKLVHCSRWNWNRLTLIYLYLIEEAKLYEVLFREIKHKVKEAL